MKLDFTALDTIAIQDIKEGFIPLLEHEEGYLWEAPEKPAKEPIISPRLDQEKRERAQLRETYTAQQRNVKQAGNLRSEILKGIKQGKDPLALLLQAMECISLMTGDTHIYNQSKEDIIAIYGYGLEESAPLHIELEEARARYKMLTRPELITAETPPETARKIEKAITTHRDLITALEGKIKAHEEEQSL